MDVATLEQILARGVEHHRAHRLAEAEAAYREVLAHARHPHALHLLGVVAHQSGHHELAVELIGESLALRPDQPGSLTDLGAALRELGRIAEAEAHYRRALEIDPNFALAYNNLGVLCATRDRLPEAVACWERALQIPGGPEIAHLNLAFAWLTMGDFARGWPEYEWRWRVGRQVGEARHYEQPQWMGEPLAGRTILIFAEQGYGDTVQMARYIPLVAAMGARVLFEAPMDMHALFRDLEGVSQWVTLGDAPPPFDFYSPIMSLPLAFGTSAGSTPAEVPYLRPPAANAAKWASRLRGEKRLKVGLAWAGRDTHPEDRARSIPLVLMAPFLAVPGVCFVSLQKGDRSRQSFLFPEVLDWTAEFENFGDTAALISQLDLVIAVDTVIVHLAGALAVPVWTLVAKIPDWRWGLNGDDSAWYPTMRLFRQQTIDDWPTVILNVTRALPLLTRATKN